MKKSLSLFAAAIALVGLAGTAGAQTATFVKSIDLSSQSNFPVAVGELGGDLYISSFNNRRVLKVADPLGATPVVTTHFDAAALTTWGGGRGLIGLNIGEDNLIYVAGEDGTAGVYAILDTTVAPGNVVKSQTGLTRRLTSIVPYGGANSFVASYILSSSLARYTYDATTTTEAEVTGVFTSPVNANIRGLVKGGTDTFFFSRNGTTNDAIGGITATTPGSIAGLTTGTALFTASGANAVSGYDLGYWADENLIIGIDITALSVVFVPAAGGAPVYTITDATNITAGPRDGAVFSSGGSDYIAITVPGATPPTGDKVLIYELTGFPNQAASVSDWTTME